MTFYTHGSSVVSASTVGIVDTSSEGDAVDIFYSLQITNPTDPRIIFDNAKDIVLTFTIKLSLLII